jgi:prolyl-tRNA editing enzyme YbaK/EbsC (Cys-tRNA(Pro) deacylase)
LVENLSRSARKIRDVLVSLGVDLEVVQLPSSTRTAAEAASAIGCQVAQIAKSIVFRTLETGKPVLVVASGVNRVNESSIRDRVGEPVEKADADFVREKTGFAIGGVPPVGHLEPIYTIVDEELLQLGDVWAAAGTPNSVFRLNGKLLLEMTSGVAMSVK